MRAITDNPRAIREQIAVQAIGAEALLYDERRHMAFCLNATASTVWRHADGTRTIAEIAATAGVELGNEIGEEVVRIAVDDLQRNGLAVWDDGVDSSSAANPAAHVLSRRTMLARLSIGAAALLPVVASIVAPTAAQAYSGCVDCSVAGPRRIRRNSAPAVAPSTDPSE
jgi:hypothetical protein